MVWHRTLICFVCGGGYPPLWAPSPFRLGRPGVVPLLFLIQRLLWTSRWCDGGDSQRRRGGTRRKHESYGRTPGCRLSSVFVDFFIFGEVSCAGALFPDTEISQATSQETPVAVSTRSAARGAWQSLSQPAILCKK